MRKRTSFIVCLSMLAACQQQAALSHKPVPSSQYMSSISDDGTSVVIKLPNGQQRRVTSELPTYSATIGQISVKNGQAHLLVINATQPTVLAQGRVTGGFFKPSSPDGAHWQLTALHGVKIDAKHSKRPPYLRMSGGQMHGLTGCNIMSGVYYRQNEKMQFVRVQGTTSDCPQFQTLEKEFIGALQQLRTWQITPDYRLQFLSEQGQVVAEFVALSP